MKSGRQLLILGLAILGAAAALFAARFVLAKSHQDLLQNGERRPAVLTKVWARSGRRTTYFARGSFPHHSESSRNFTNQVDRQTYLRLRPLVRSKEPVYVRFDAKQPQTAWLEQGAVHPTLGLLRLGSIFAAILGGLLAAGGVYLRRILRPPTADTE